MASQTKVRKTRISRSKTTTKSCLDLSRTKPTRTSTFDHDSGLMFDQYETSQGVRSDVAWVVSYRTPSIVRTRTRPNDGDGARSLCNMALMKLGLESYNLTPEVLRTIPWSVGQLIWKQIVDDHAESYYIWRTFAVAFGYDFARKEHRYLLELRSPTRAFDEYAKGLDSKSGQWLVSLRISPKQVTVPDLIAVSAITNLSVLDLSDGKLYIEHVPSNFDLRVMRTYSELAAKGRAFQHLRVLMLGWQEKADSWIFELLDSFPQICMLVVTDCRMIDHKNHRDWEDQAWKYGWQFQPAKRGVKHLRTLLDDRSFYVGTTTNMNHEATRIIKDQGMLDGTTDTPILECWFGRPSTWTHVIDEFPGTRTVIFEKKPKQTSHVPQQSLTKAIPDQQNQYQEQVPRERSNDSQKHARPQPKRPKHNATSLLAEFS